MSSGNQPQQQPQPAGNPVWLSVLGWILTLLVAGAMIASGVTKVMKVKFEGQPDIGFNEDTALGLGYIEIGAGVLYLFPPTSVLGAIVLTGYLGGAVLTHIRLADWILLHLVIGTLMWTGLVWRNERLRSVTPWGRDADEPAGGFLAAVGKIFVVLLALAGVVAALAVAQPEDYRIERSIKIAAPASDVFPHVNDFNKWKPWIPFLDADPETPIKIAGTQGKEGASYNWNSTNDKVGEGTMTLIESVPNERVKFKLEFVRPFKGEAEAEFTFKQEGNETIVTWAIIGKRDYTEKVKASVIPFNMILGELFTKGLTRMKDEVKKK